MLDETKKAKLLKAIKEKKVTDKQTLAIFLQNEDLKEELDAKMQGMADPLKGVDQIKIKGQKGDKGDEPSDERLQELITPLIPEPIKGDKGDAGDDAKMVGPEGKKGERGENGKDGKDGLNGRDGKDGKNGINGKDGSPDTRLQIVKKINAGTKKDTKIEVSQLEGFAKIESDITSRALSILDQRSQFLINKTVKHDGTLSGAGTDASPLSVVGGAGGGGTVTSVSITTANGISGSVADSTTTPAITLDITALDATKIANGAVTNTEFQYLDGVTSAIQTQINTKQATLVSGTTIKTINGASILASGDLTLLTSLSGAVLTDQTAGQTIGLTGSRLTKLWATDITLTNALVGSVTGNAGTVTNGVYTTGADSVYLTPATAASTYQPLDADLTTIAGLTATTDNFLVSVSSAWASRTPSQVRTTLALVIGTNVQAYDADLTTWAGITPGTGVGTALAVNVGSAGAFVTFNGALGTPSSGVATNITGLPAGAILPGTLVAGTYLLAENASIGLDPAGSADGKYSGITVTGTGGATIAFGRLVYLKASDSQWYECDADAIATSGGLIGMTVTTTTDNNPVTVLLYGQIRADASFPALTIGAPVYAGETVGDIQVAIPTGADAVIRVVGFALTADEIIFNPSQDNQTVVA